MKSTETAGLIIIVIIQIAHITRAYQSVNKNWLFIVYYFFCAKEVVSELYFHSVLSALHSDLCPINITDD